MVEVVATSRQLEHYSQDSATIPPGWTANPSALRRRQILAVLATIGMLTAGYLALYQIGVVSTVWEPFFGHGSKTILNSGLSRAIPVPDAFLGAAAYFSDALLALVGREDRWWSNPWFVLANGATSIGLGLAATVLLIIQPLVYGNYCTLCIFSAFISINLVGPMMAETLAALQYLGRKYTEPTSRQKEQDVEKPGRSDYPSARNQHEAEGLRLRHLIGAGIGLWLMASPAVIGFAGYARADMRLVGPIVFVLSILSVWPATRWFSRLNAFAGLWLMIGSILLQAPHLLVFSNIMVGAVLVAISIFPGNAAPQTNGGWIGILGPGSEIP